MKNKLINKILAFTLAIILCCSSSCDYGDTNKDATRISDKDLEVASVTAPLIVGTFHFYGQTLSWYNMLFTQHLSGPDRQAAVIGVNNIIASDADNVWGTNGIYAQFLPLAKKLESLSNGTTKVPYALGISYIYYALFFGIATDIFGDVPYTQALDVEKYKLPIYDTQESIYTALFNYLDKAIVELKKESSENNLTLLTQLKNTDLLYKGDATKWLNVAYALKARYKIQSRLRNTNGAKEALDVANLCGFDGTNSFAYTFPGSNNATAPLYGYIVSRGDIRVSTFLVNMLKNNGNGVEDPRLSVLVEKTSSGYVGSPLGTSASTVASTLGTYFNSANAKVVISSDVEIHFIKAEAEFVLGNLVSAASHLNSAIKASLVEVMGNSSYVDFLNANTYTATNINLESIMKHKYIAMMSNYVTYNDWRRTGFPTLTKVPGASSDTDFVLSWPYSQSEVDTNSKLPIKEATTKRNTRVWWDLD